MIIHERHPLRAGNTLGFDVRAERFVEVASEDALHEAVEHAAKHRWPLFMLGGGSNIVLTGDIPGLVVRQVDATVSRDGDRLTAAAGVRWDELVRQSLDRGLNGLENLSLIPGDTGAAPIQNIGAYGVELADRLVAVRAFHVPSGEWHDLDRADCRFGYRDSRFKQERGEHVITSITLALGRQCPLTTDYASLARELECQGIEHPTAHDVAAAVVRIRQSKLPDPAVIGNAGSFFKNPSVTADHYDTLRQVTPGLIGHPDGQGHVKLAAGQLIEVCGFKGTRRGPVGVHGDQALVLVHHGEGQGKDLLALASEIADAVLERFGVELVIEPTVVPGVQPGVVHSLTIDQLES